MINFGKTYEIRLYRSRFDEEPYLTIVSDQKNMLRITFEIKKSYLSALSRNSLTLIIYNLKQGTRDLIRDTNDYIEFKAGWRGYPLKTIFRGEALAVNHRVSPPNAVTEMLCLDNIAAENNTSNWSFGENTYNYVAVEKIIKEDNIEVGYNGIDKEAKFASGYAASDTKSIDVIKDIANKADCVVAINDGKLDIFRKNIQNLSEEVKDQLKEEAIPVNEQNGMIGYPQRFGNNFKNPFLTRVVAANYSNSWRSAVQLNGDIRIYKYVSITCPALNINSQVGLVIGVLHAGDTHGGVWQTTIDSFGV